ncbi:putative phosphonate catabolism associated alcohol dehydrogenase [Kribbella aluminosa]|uniref:alcohol dehydrogenase n=1 Tax=Kribbella aluminosa TaxID=416017 RepID=A0ABS4UX14_9ACTN|nr:zinc-binding dehydrogenase [Kribbella aluminosa]MBP2356166.1 putative phosphonate catabolism associated alcohol dehydrogenase [Kribbella aluminosa]
MTTTVNATATAAIWSGVDAGFSVGTLPLPGLRPGEVLVRTELATICGSDLHTINGDRPTPLPTVLGHEAIGHVVATGGDVTAADGAPVSDGDRITWTIGTSCGTCRRCLRGIPQKCLSVRKYGHEAIDDHWKLNGGFGTHVHLVAGTGVVKLPQQLPATVATPANCATATVTCAARRTNLTADDVVVVLGCGMLGLTAVAYARDRGCATVIASDVDPARRELATLFGATTVVEPQDLAAATSKYGADVIFELSGNSRAVQSAFDVVDLGGRIALVGSVSPAPEISFEPSGFVKNLTTVVGSHNYRVDDLVEAVDFLERTAVQQLFADLIPAPYPLADIVPAVATASSSTAPRIAVHFP